MRRSTLVLKINPCWLKYIIWVMMPNSRPAIHRLTLDYMLCTNTSSMWCSGQTADSVVSRWAGSILTRCSQGCSYINSLRGRLVYVGALKTLGCPINYHSCDLSVSARSSPTQVKKIDTNLFWHPLLTLSPPCRKDTCDSGASVFTTCADLKTKEDQ